MKKDLRLYLRNNMPGLAYYYIDAQKDVFQASVWVPQKDFNRFRTMESKLHAAGVSVKDYAYTVTRLSKDSVQSKNLGHTPISMFLGLWLFGKYEKILNSQSVSTIPDEVVADAELIDSESKVAYRFIESNMGSACEFDTCVYDLKKLLSKRWLELYDSDSSRVGLVDETLDRLCDHYRIKRKGINSYTELLELLGY